MKKNKEEKRVIPVKNYIFLVLLVLAVVIIVFYLCDLYQVYDAHQREVPVIGDTLVEISPDELDHYIMENPTSVVYMCTASDSFCRHYERDLKKLIEKDNLQDTIIYLNLSDIDVDSFVDSFNSRYPYRVLLTTSYPALVVFEEGEVQGILQGSKKEKLTISKTEQFIEMHQIQEQGEGE